MTLRHDWTRPEIGEILRLPLIELLFRAQQTHRQYFQTGEVQKSTLLSIKTGGCSEDCGYCPQSAHHKTGVERQGLLTLEEVMNKAKRARDTGSARFCMGAAWREVKDGSDFDSVLEMVREVSGMGLEVCCTLGMLTAAQAARLKEAGLTAYNHNLDTSPEFYGKVISTRTYDDRLKTLDHIRQAGIQVCSGGIIGMGEGEEDRIGLLYVLATQNPHPESVPINMLVKVEGTPLAHEKETDPLTLVRMIATARILMPESLVRLSAGRSSLSREAQALCFLAGANSIFTGDVLLTTPNPAEDEDARMFADLGLKAMPPQKAAV